MSIFVLLGGLSGGISVALGAFGAHALQSRLTPERLETFETGVRYQIYHALALLGAAFAAMQWPGSSLALVAGWAFVAGMLLFSGSLYLLVLTGKRWWGAITPFGGLAFIVGWLCLAFTPFQ
ncbi:MAG: DUF423 domain-containing protein [Anaerolineales bacterium]|jgi:uncharacterized membrane protein YgdD (TMEM256/DUF423 family)